MAVVETWWTGVMGGQSLRRLRLHRRDDGTWAVEYEHGAQGHLGRVEGGLTQEQARARMQYAMGRHPGDRWIRQDTWDSRWHGALVIERDITWEPTTYSQRQAPPDTLPS